SVYRGTTRPAAPLQDLSLREAPRRRRPRRAPPADHTLRRSAPGNGSRRVELALERGAEIGWVLVAAPNRPGRETNTPEPGLRNAFVADPGRGSRRAVFQRRELSDLRNRTHASG